MKRPKYHCNSKQIWILSETCIALLDLRRDIIVAHLSPIHGRHVESKQLMKVPMLVSTSSGRKIKEEEEETMRSTHKSTFHSRHRGSSLYKFQAKQLLEKIFPVWAMAGMFVHPRTRGYGAVMEISRTVTRGLLTTGAIPLIVDEPWRYSLLVVV